MKTRIQILLFLLLGAFVVPAPAEATWSVIAIDLRTGQIVVASATCVSQARLRSFPSRGLMDVQAIVVPGMGVAVAQAGVDRTRANQELIHRELVSGTDPAEILELLREDPRIEQRQFAIVDRQGRSAGFTGEGNSEAAIGLKGTVPGQEIAFSIQGNILASDEVVQLAAAAFIGAHGTLADRAMAAMEAADRAGGDRRCTCETQPVPTDVPCTDRTAHVAYLMVAEPDDAPGASYNDGDWSLLIDVTDENIVEGEDANPVVTLRKRYDTWKGVRAPPPLSGIRRAR
jgi:uncharacterized Ntn-hydrolase superfamily protein